MKLELLSGKADCTQKPQLFQSCTDNLSPRLVFRIISSSQFLQHEAVLLNCGDANAAATLSGR